MEERYEILGRIGKGGLGSVHRAFDHKLNREVAVKRILTSNEDPTLQEEATKQLMMEAGALAALQHPHIVTVHDVGLDEEGPYVVMELISGKTLDEIIENAPLTWQDFKEIATQSLEALIAAQELNMIHSDLKPQNIMLTWLPSGKFQIKIVDFGLAVLVQNQIQEEIEKMDSVFGSIFFMPPEQFERKTLDARSDLYSLGCCFYQALTGGYPFEGENVTEVIEAHLGHKVKPISERRSDIPSWACQWIMWLINRNREDRPESAREALANFLQNDKKPNPAMSHGGNQAPMGPRTANSPTSANAGVGAEPTSVAPGATNRSVRRPSKTHMMIAGAVGVVLLVLSGVMIKRHYERKSRENAYQRIVAMTKRAGAGGIEISRTDLDTVFEIVSQAKPETNLAPAIQVLTTAYPSDGSDFDGLIVGFATTASMPTTARKQMFDEVLTKRRVRFAAPALLEFAANSKSPDEAACALNAARGKISDGDVPKLVGIISSASQPPVISAAASLIEDLVGRSTNRSNMARIISNNRMSNTTPEARHALDRLLEICNPSKPQQAHTPPKKPTPTTTPSQPKPPASNSQPKPAEAPGSSKKYDPLLDPLIGTLKGNDPSKQIEAWNALADSKSKDAHAVFMDYASQMQDPKVHLHAVMAAIKLASAPEIITKEKDSPGRWMQIQWRTKSLDEKKLWIEGLAKVKTPTTINLIRQQANAKEGELQAFAKKTLEQLEKADGLSGSK